MLKYEIGQKVWLIYEDEIRHGIVTYRHFSEDGTEKSKKYALGNLYKRPDYLTIGIKNEALLFETKQDLLEHLSKTAEEEG